MGAWVDVVVSVSRDFVIAIHLPASSVVCTIPVGGSLPSLPVPLYGPWLGSFKGLFRA